MKKTMRKRGIRLLALLLTMLLCTGCAATEDPLVQKTPIKSRVDLSQVPAPENGTVYLRDFCLPETDPQVIGKAFLGERNFTVESFEQGYWWHTDREEELLRTYANVGPDGVDLTKDCVYIQYARNGSDIIIAQPFMYAVHPVQGNILAELAEQPADDPLYEASVQDARRIMDALNYSCELLFSGRFSPEAQKELSAMIMTDGRATWDREVYAVYFRIVPSDTPAGMEKAVETTAWLFYDSEGLIMGRILSEWRVHAAENAEVQPVCSAETAYQAAVAGWHQDGAVLHHASLELTSTGGSADELELYWVFDMMYPVQVTETNQQKIEQLLSKLGEYRDEVQGVYDIERLYVRARDGVYMENRHSYYVGNHFINRYNSPELFTAQ